MFSLLCLCWSLTLTFSQYNYAPSPTASVDGPIKFYSYNGSNNNLNNPLQGLAGEFYYRKSNENSYLSYTDSIGSLDTTKTNPRIISNLLGQFSKSQSVNGESFSQLSSMSLAWGVLLVKDLCSTSFDFSDSAYYPINIPQCDVYLDPYCEGNRTLAFFRSEHSFEYDPIDNTSYRAFINHNTGYIDASFLYGKSEDDINGIRTFSGGKIITGTEVSGIHDILSELYGMTGHSNYLNGEGDITKCPFFSNAISGVNVGFPNWLQQSGLQTLFALEHNRIATALYKNFSAWSDERLFQEARARVIALVQYITYNEYLPLLLGKFSIINEFPSYNSSVDSGVSDMFCASAYRFAHSGLPDDIVFAGENKNASLYYGGNCEEILSRVDLSDSTWHPCLGLDIVDHQSYNGYNDSYLGSLLGGTKLSSEEEIDIHFIEEIRSKMNLQILNGIYGGNNYPNTVESDFTDIFAINIQRGRDHGMPLYNDARELYGLDRIASFNDLTSDKYLLRVLPLIYPTIDDVELYVGGLIEDKEATVDGNTASSGHLSSIFAAIIRDQFIRLYVGDKKMYKWNSQDLVDFVEGVTLKQIIERNTNVYDLDTDLFSAGTAVETSTSGNLFTDEFGNIWSFAKLLDDKLIMRWRIHEVNSNLYTDRNNKLFLQMVLDIKQSRKGFIGVGFGKGSYMSGKDIIKMMWDRDDNDNLFAMDSYSSNWFPDPDTKWPNGQDDVSDVSGSIVDTTVTITCSRPLLASDKRDFPILEGTQDFIVSFNRGSLTDKHNTNERTPGKINWFEGTVTETSVSYDRVLLYHGLTMIALFGIAYPTSAFVARYLRQFPWWREWHKLMGTLGTMTSVTAAYSAAGTVDRDKKPSKHSILGITCCTILVAQVFFGHTTNYWLNNLSRGLIYKRMKYCHLGFAIVLNSLAPYTMYRGWKLLNYADVPGLEYPIVWYIFALTITILGELYRRYWPAISSNNEFLAFNSNYHVFSMDEIAEKVSAGAAWLIIDNFVYDVSRWQYSHPGGRRILLDHMGTDVTNLFYGIEPLKIAHGGRTYAHSQWAKKQMAKIIVGEIDLDNDNVNIKKHKLSKQDKRKSVRKIVTYDKESKKTVRVNKVDDWTNRSFTKYNDITIDDLVNTIIDEGDLDLSTSIGDNVLNGDMKKPLLPVPDNSIEYDLDEMQNKQNGSNTNGVKTNGVKTDGENDVKSPQEKIKQAMIELVSNNSSPSNIPNVKKLELIQVNSKSTNNNNNTLSTPTTPTITKLKHMKSTLGVNYSRPAKISNVKQLYLQQERINKSKRFRNITLVGKTILTPPSCTRPVVLLEFDYETETYDCGEYVLLHYVNKESLSRAYSLVPPEFVYCDANPNTSNNCIYKRQQEKSEDRSLGASCWDIIYNFDNILYTIFEYLFCARINKKIDAKSDKNKRLFLMIRLYPNGRMSYILKRLAVYKTLRMTGPFMRQEMLPNNNVDNGYGVRCWRYNILICGGTGITPMFHLIIHQLTYGNEKNKMLLLWFNNTVQDLFALDQLKYLQSIHSDRFYLFFIFTKPMLNENSNNSDLEEEYKLDEWSQVFYKKWNNSQNREMIRKFLNDGKPLDTKLLQVLENTQLSKSKNKLKSLNKDDRIIISGPKRFVDSYLTLLKETPDFSKVQMGKQTISLD